MPTTLTGLLLFVLLLLPGFAYLVGKERAGTERRTSAFRETVTIVSASVTSELIVLVLASPAWSRAFDLERLLANPGTYWRQNYAALTTWSLVLLVTSVALAYTATTRSVRRMEYVWRRLPKTARKWTWVRLIEQRTTSYPHPSTVSSWGMMFGPYRDGRTAYVGVVLDDGSYVQGRLASSNNSADDIADRDLIVYGPIEYRAPGATKTVKWTCDIASVSARRIVAMVVTYKGVPLSQNRHPQQAVETEDRLS